MLESLMFFLWGHTKEKKTIIFDDENCDMIPELNKETEVEHEEGSRKKIHPMIAQLKDKELKFSKMQRQNRKSKH